MDDILERLELDIEGGSAEPWVLETCTLAAAEIKRLRGTLQSIRDERAFVVDNRESQMIAEIKRRGKEIERLKAQRKQDAEYWLGPKSKMYEDIGQIVDALDNEEDPWAENGRLLAQLHETRAERDLAQQELENLQAQMNEVNLVAWKKDAEEVKRLQMIVREASRRFAAIIEEMHTADEFGALAIAQSAQDWIRQHVVL